VDGAVDIPEAPADGVARRLELKVVTVGLPLVGLVLLAAEPYLFPEGEVYWSRKGHGRNPCEADSTRIARGRNRLGMEGK